MLTVPGSLSQRPLQTNFVPKDKERGAQEQSNPKQSPSIPAAPEAGRRGLPLPMCRAPADPNHRHAGSATVAGTRSPRPRGSRGRGPSGATGQTGPASGQAQKIASCLGLTSTMRAHWVPLPAPGPPRTNTTSGFMRR